MTFPTTPPLPSERSKPLIAIIGGGVTGAAVALHLASERPGSADIVIFEPRDTIGKGLAYDTADPVHRINVPAAKMSVFPDQPEHFARWLEATGALVDDTEALRPDGSVFPRRSLFGDYVLSNLHPLLQTGTVRHIRAAVTAVEKVDMLWKVTDQRGRWLIADILVVATSHPSPVPPVRLANALAGHPRFITEPTSSNALVSIRADDRVLVIGNGLTSADVIASLKRRGHVGKVTALSRRGLRSRGHDPFTQEPFGDFLSSPSTTATELLVRIRSTIRTAAKEGLTWHPVIDQVRAQGGAIWSHLPVSERRRIVRHLRPYWDVHRFRVAPQVEGVLDDEISSGRLNILGAALLEVDTDGDIIRVIVRPRGGNEVEEHRYNAVVVTTGPAHGGILSSQEWLRRLGEDGYLQMDPTGLGLACDRNANAIGSNGVTDGSLFIAGPLARGQFGELMGFPQVAEHAVLVGHAITRRI